VYATVNVIEPPEMTILPEVSTICPDSFIVLTATAPGVDSLLWTPSNTLSCDDCLMPTATPLMSTTYTLSGKYKSCPVAKSAMVIVNQAPVYQFPGGGNKCAGESLTLNLVNDPSVTSYTWTSNPPMVIPSEAQPTVTLHSMGVQSITFYLEAYNGCTIRDSFKIQITDVSLMISLPDTICPKTVKLINAQVSIGGGQFAWSTGSTAQAITVMPIATTTYTVTYDLNGCSFQDSVEIVVQGQTPDVQFPSDIALCPGDTIVLNSVETPGATYQWSANVGGFTSNEAIPDSLVLYESTIFTVTATSLDGCKLVDSVKVTVFNATLDVSEDVTVCAGEPFSVSATGSATGSYLWTPGSFTTPSFTQTLNNEQTIDYTVLYTYGTPGNECQLDSSVSVQVLRNFMVNIVADPDSVLNLGESVLLDAVILPSQSVNGFTFDWLESNTTAVGNTEQITVTPATADTFIVYTVTVTSPSGCTQVETIRFRILQPKVEYPNAFTPNGDDANDSFGLVVTEGTVTVERLEIYNRWGAKIYESTDANAHWDGKSDGKDAPSDVYVYKIRWRRGDGSLTLKSGEVTLLR
jgi:large repetitive protein